MHAARRWGGVRKKIEGGDEDDKSGAEQQQGGSKNKDKRSSNSSKAEEDEEEQEDPFAISDVMIDEAMGQTTYKGKDDENRDLKKFTSTSSSSTDAAAAAEPTKWSMEWLESLSEEGTYI